MTDRDDAEPRRGLRPSMSRTLLVVGLLLAVGATVALVLSDSVRWLRLGVLAALWAALAGAFVAGRFRKDASNRAEEIDTLHSVYELELEREVAARREHELEAQVEAQRKAESDSSEQLAALRAELRGLREQLETLVGGDVLVERVALHAESTRMRSIGETGQQEAVRADAIPGRRSGWEGQPERSGWSGQDAQRRPANIPAALGDRTVRRPPVAAQEQGNGWQAAPQQGAAQPAGTPPQSPAAQGGMQQREPAARTGAEVADRTPPRRPQERQQSTALWPSLPRTQGNEAARGGQRDESAERRAAAIDPDWTPSWETAERQRAAVPPAGAEPPPSRPAEQPQQQDVAAAAIGGRRRRTEGSTEPAGDRQSPYTGGPQFRSEPPDPAGSGAYGPQAGRHGGAQGYQRPGGRRRREDHEQQPSRFQAAYQQAQYQQPQGRHGGGHGMHEQEQQAAGGHGRHGNAEPEPDTGAHSEGRAVSDLLGSGTSDQPRRRRRRED